MSRKIILIITATFSLYAFAWTVRISGYGFNKTATVGFGCYSSQICYVKRNHDVIPPGAVIFKTGGYDGQFFYYIAADIYSSYRAEVDSDEFRRSRIGYPLLIGWAYLFGREALLLSMSIIPLLFHLLAVYLLLQYYSRKIMLPGYGNGEGVINSRTNEKPLLKTIGSAVSTIPLLDRIKPILQSDTIAVIVFAFNPFSLLCFMLNVADGLALSLAMIGMIFYFKAECTGGIFYRAIAFICISFSLLTKETMLAIPIGFIAAAFTVTFKEKNRSFYTLIFFSMSVIPLIAWWFVIGFSPVHAAAHGGWPYKGFVDYLRNPDALYSQRTMLVFILPVFTFFGFILLYKSGIKNIFTNRYYRSTLEKTGLALSLLAVSVLISFATGHEYWMNFANIGRFFTPGVLLISFVSAFFPENRPVKYGVRILLVLFLLLGFIMIQKEFTGEPLPFVVY